MRKLLFLPLVIIFLLACNFSAENFTTGEISISGTFQTLNLTTPFQTITPTQESPGPIYNIPFVRIDGCWNVREAPNFNSRILRVQCGGRVSPTTQVGGYYYIGDGYMCGRAWGEKVTCGK
jgi:hypothetical protein